MRDSTGFDAFYASSVRRVIAQVYVMIGDLSEAEDAVQEAYARAWARWDTVGAYADPVAWVRTVAHRIAVSSWRRTRNRLLAHERSAGRDLVSFDANTLALVEALRQVPPRPRRALVLYHLVGLPIQDIAAETGDSVSAVKAQLSRARRALAAQLDPDRIEEGDRSAG